MSLMYVHWLEQAESDVPRDDEWLGQSELVRLKSFFVLKRRSDWRLGRWTAKHTVASYLQLPFRREILACIEIRAASSGAPEVFVKENRLQLCISLSHRAGKALCTISTGDMALGCDLELIETRSGAFVADYFTEQEQQYLAALPPASRMRLVSLFWSAKESALKALHEGLRIDTRSLSVQDEATLGDIEGWSRLRINSVDGHVFHGWWQQSDGFVRTIAAASPLQCPIQLTSAPPSLSACA